MKKNIKKTIFKKRIFVALSAIVLLAVAGTAISYFVFFEKTNKKSFSEVLNHFIKSWRKWIKKNPYILHELNWNELRDKKVTKTSFVVPKDKNLEDYFLLVKFEKQLNKFSLTIKKKKKDSFIVYSEDNGVLGLKAQSDIIAEVEELWTNEWNKEQKEKMISELEQIENINGKPVAKEEKNTYDVNVQISGEDDQSETTNFAVTITIGPKEATEEDSKAWDSKWKILTASILAPGGEPEEVGLTGANANRISEINTKISKLKAEKDKAARLAGVKTALNAFSPQSEFITFADDWAANLDENTPVEIDFTAPAEKDLTDYKLKVSYSDEAITFEIISKMDNSQIWTSTDLESGPIAEASQIDTTLLTTIITQVETKWAEEWKKESGQTFLTSLQNSFANLDKSRLTTEINDSEDLDKEYETTFTLTKSSSDGTEINFTINLKFQLFSSDEDAEVWEKEWAITEATYTLSGDANAVATSFTFEDNSDTAAKIAKINTDLQTPADTEAAVRKLKAFIEKLKTWDDDLSHTTTAESTWDSLAAGNPVTLTFSPPSGKEGLSELTLKVSYINEEITFEILDDEENNIWRSSSITSKDSINDQLKTTITEQVENKWAEEWEAAEKTRIENSLEIIATSESWEITKKEWEQIENQYKYKLEFTLNIDDQDDLQVNLEIGIGYLQTSPESTPKEWEKEMKIQSLKIDSKAGEFSWAEENISINGEDHQKNILIKNKVQEAERKYEKWILLVEFINKLKTWDDELTYVMTDESTWNDLSDSNPITLEFTPPADKGLSTFTLQTQFDGTNIIFKILDSEDREVWTSANEKTTPFSNSDKITPELRATIIEKVEEQWANEWKEVEKTRIENLLKTITDLESPETIQGRWDDNENVYKYELAVSLSVNNQDNLQVNLEIDVGYDSAPPQANLKDWEKTMQIRSLTVNSEEGDFSWEEENTSLTGTENQRILTINSKVQEAKAKYEEWILTEFREKLKTWDDALTYVTTIDSTWDGFSNGNPVSLTFSPPDGKDGLSELTLKAEYEENKIVFKILDSTNSEIWTSSSITSEGSIDEQLKTTIKERVENKWAEEWKLIQETQIIELMNKKMDFRSIQFNAEKSTENNIHYLKFQGFLPAFGSENAKSFSVKVGVGPSETVPGLNLSDWKLLSANIEIGVINRETIDVSGIENQDDLNLQIQQINKEIARKASGSENPTAKQINNLIVNSLEQLAQEKVYSKFGTDFTILRQINSVRITDPKSESGKILTIIVRKYTQRGNKKRIAWTLKVYLYVKRWKLDLNKEDKIFKIKYMFNRGSANELNLSEEFNEISYDASGIHHYIVTALKTIESTSGSVKF